MNLKRVVGFLTCTIVMSSLSLPLTAQGNRGKAELKAGGGTITVDYGRPSLKGRDMLSQLKPGEFWRMGMNEATILTTPVELTFGATKIAKGSYRLFLTRDASDKFELVANSQSGQSGAENTPSKDAARIALKKDAASPSAEAFTIDLKEAPGGGTFVMTWGTTRLSADFKAAR